MPGGMQHRSKWVLPRRVGLRACAIVWAVLLALPAWAVQPTPPWQAPPRPAVDPGPRAMPPAAAFVDPSAPPRRVGPPHRAVHDRSPHAGLAPEDHFGQLGAGFFEETFASRWGVVALGPPKPLVARAGLASTAGTHTLGVEQEAGLAGAVPLMASLLTYDVSNSFGAFDEQFGYQFEGIENNFAVELTFGPRPRLGHFHLLGSLSAGWRMDWFYNRSFRQLRDAARGPDDDHSPLSQRVGTFILQWDWLTEDGAYHRVRALWANDGKHTGGETDAFRTAAIRVRYLRQCGDWQWRAGIGVDLFTGDVDQQRYSPDGSVYLTRGLPFDSRSQGLLEIEWGFSRFVRHGRLLSEWGLTLSFGPDTEALRDFFQNDVAHRITDIPEYPRIDRPDRFKFDVLLFYTLHFG